MRSFALRLALVASAISGGSCRRGKTSCSEAKEGDELVVDCGGQFISQIKFASYGVASCTNAVLSTLTAHVSLSAVLFTCLAGLPQGKCVIGAEYNRFTRKSSCHSSASALKS